jgi:hypothetical protein
VPVAIPVEEKEMKKRIKATVFLAEGKVYEAYDIDRRRGKIGGYKLFPAYGQSNPYREFDIAHVEIRELRK